MSNPPVLIVGGGPTGLTLAGELIKRGVLCRIIDNQPGPSDQSKALAIHARTLELFEKMGLVEEFLAVSWKIHAFTVYDRKTRLVKMTFDELESPYPFMLSLPQVDTERILIHHLTNVGGTVERNTSLTALSQDGEGAIATVQMPDGRKEEVKARWVVGCDGAHSAVRKMIDMQFTGMEYAEDWVLADVQVDSTLDQSESYLFSNEDGVAGYHAFALDRGRIFADLGTTHDVTDRKRERAAPLVAPSLEKLQSILDERGPGQLTIRNLNWLSMHSIHRRQVKSYRKDHVFLAGDAAHVHSPASGQGMNTGIQDAFNLAWKLALVEGGGAHESLLDSYNAERHSVGQSVLRMTDFFTWINVVRNPVAQKIRNRIGPLMAEQDIVAHHYRNAVCEISANYRKSPAVAEVRLVPGVQQPLRLDNVVSDLKHWFDFDSGPRAGDRAPDAHFLELKTGRPVTLFECTRDIEHHLLLLVGLEPNDEETSELESIANLVSKRFAKHVRVHLFASNEERADSLNCAGDKYIDSDLSLHHRYRAESSCLYLVRPDGYVGFRTLPANKEQLVNYLDSIFV